MKPSLLIVPLFFLSCATADITADRDAMKSIKTVAVVPFTSSSDLKKEILTESEEKFRTALTDLNYKIVDTEKTGILQKDKEFTINSITTENVKESGKLIGADAVMFGEITDCREVQYNTHFHSAHRFGKAGHHRNTDEIKPLINFKFRITVKLVDVSDGSVILSVRNRYDGSWYDEEQRGYDSLYSYRNMVLNKMVNELISFMKENR